LNLAAADARLANRFATDALQAAVGKNYNEFLLFGLAQLLSPNLPQDARPSEPVAAAIQQALAAGMLRPAQNAADQKAICDLAAPVTTVMKKFSPEQQGLLQAAVENCKRMSPANTRNVNDVETRNRDSAAAELLKEAADTADAHPRAMLKQQAARRAMREKDYARALEIYDSFTPEERKAYPTWRWERGGAAQVALEAWYKAHDLQAVQQVIARAPDNERASLTLNAASLGFLSKDPSYGLVMLTQARRELEKNPVTDNHRVYMELLRLYARNAPEEAVSVLRLVVSGINSFKEPENARVRWMPPGWKLQPIGLPAAVLDSDPEMAAAAIAEIKSPQARIAMRLGLLQACLQRYQQPTTPATPARKTESKPKSKGPDTGEKK
jgi:hypothetical protein